MLKRNDKKASVEASILFIVAIASLAIFFLIVAYIGNTLGSELKTKIGIRTEINDSLATTEHVSSTMLGPIWWIVFLGLLLGVIVSGLYAMQYPAVLLPIFVLCLLTSIIVGVAMSNAYEELATNPTLSPYAAQQYDIGWMMSKLPYLALIVGIIGIIIVIARPKTEETAIM